MDEGSELVPSMPVERASLVPCESFTIPEIIMIIRALTFKQVNVLLIVVATWLEKQFATVTRTENKNNFYF